MEQRLLANNGQKKIQNNKGKERNKMKQYVKPEVDIVEFYMEVIADDDTGTNVVSGDQSNEI